MRVLIADDDIVLRHSLPHAPRALVLRRRRVRRWRAGVGGAAGEKTPSLAIFDWNMPGRDGPSLCRDLRQIPALSAMYVILITSNQDQKDVVCGLESGADDYIKKPFDWNELRARLRIGSRIVSLQHALAARVADLQQALSTSNASEACCRSARTANASATTATTGSRSSSI